MRKICQHALVDIFDIYPAVHICRGCGANVTPLRPGECRRCNNTGWFRTSNPSDTPIPCPDPVHGHTAGSTT